jgi:hypothetical protein
MTTVRPPTFDELLTRAAGVACLSRDQSVELAIITIASALLSAWTDGATAVMQAKLKRLSNLFEGQLTHDTIQ